MDGNLLSILAAAFGAATEPWNLLAVSIGLLIGIVLGAIPGLNGTMAIALLVPLTFTWSPLFSIAMLMGCWKGSVYGGSISAILLNTPGTPEAVPTARDGYPLAQQGLGHKALMTALVSAVFGALVGDLIALVAAPPISTIALEFGPVQMTSLILFALVIIAAAGGGSLLLGLVSVFLGLLLSTIGLDPIDSQRRLTFGVINLDSGFNLLAMMIGLLVLSEVFEQVYDRARAGDVKEEKASRTSANNKLNRFTFSDFRYCLGVMVRSSLLGTFFGTLPGIGSVAAAFFGYDQARLSSKHPETFGKGELQGVAAPDSANNAVCGSALIPMVTIGVPGSLAIAIIMGAFKIHGLVPGPTLMSNHPVFVYSLFFLLILSDGLMLLIGYLLFPFALAISRLPRSWLLPPIVLFCFFGAFVPRQNLFDVQVMVAFGVIGFILNRYKLSPAALLIAYILGPIIEDNFRIGLAISGGSWMIFLTSPLSAVFLALALSSAIWMVIRRRKGTGNSIE